LKSVLKVKNEWVKGEEQLSVIKVVAKGKGRDQITERSSVHDEE